MPQAYRRVLALPRVRSTILMMFFARLPLTAMGVLMTLHVVNQLDRGYGQAGLVGAATTLGAAFAAPVTGRMVDRYGLRPVVLVCGLFSTVYWVSVPHLSYPLLALIALPAGALALPANALTRQILAALVPADQRRSVFSLDMVLAEASFVIGPLAAVFVITQVSSAAALTGMGLWIGVTALALFVTNLPIREPNAEQPEQPTVPAVRPPMASWLNGRLVSALFIACGALFVLIGTELSLIAALDENGETAWTGVVIGMMSVASVAGGLVHGAVKRSLPQATLAVLLGVLVIPVGLAAEPWWLLGLALIPMNLMCTPTLAASAETVSNAAPAHVRGEAMGLQDSATRLGLALGSPVVGFVIDRSSAGWGFAAAGLGGLLFAGTGLLFRRPRRPARRPEPDVPVPV